MSTPTSVAFRAEIQAALVIVEAQVRGLEDLLKVSLTKETLAFVEADRVSHTRRRDIYRKLIADIDALEADGYPILEKVEVTPEAAAELEEQKADLAAAFGEFQPLPPASTIDVVLGDPANKP